MLERGEGGGNPPKPPKLQTSSAPAPRTIHPGFCPPCRQHPPPTWGAGQGARPCSASKPRRRRKVRGGGWGWAGTGRGGGRAPASPPHPRGPGPEGSAAAGGSPGWRGLGPRSLSHPLSTGRPGFRGPPHGSLTAGRPKGRHRLPPIPPHLPSPNPTRPRLSLAWPSAAAAPPPPAHFPKRNGSASKGGNPPTLARLARLSRERRRPPPSPAGECALDPARPRGGNKGKGKGGAGGSRARLLARAAPPDDALAGFESNFIGAPGGDSARPPRPRLNKSLW